MGEGDGAGEGEGRRRRGEEDSVYKLVMQTTMSVHVLCDQNNGTPHDSLLGPPLAINHTITQRWPSGVNRRSSPRQSVVGNQALGRRTSSKLPRERWSMSLLTSPDIPTGLSFSRYIHMYIICRRVGGGEEG